jgi:hypothetical protein
LILKVSDITGYQKILSMLSTASNTTTTTAAEARRPLGRPKATTDLRDSPASDYNQLKKNVQAIIFQMNSGVFGSQSFSWRVCGLVKLPHTAGNKSDLQPAIATALSANITSLKSAALSSIQSSWSSVLHYVSSFTTPSSPAIKRTLGAIGADPVSGSGFAGSEQGYTCGLWLLLHYITGLNPCICTCTLSYPARSSIFTPSSLFPPCLSIRVTV